MASFVAFTIVLSRCFSLNTETTLGESIKNSLREHKRYFIPHMTRRTHKLRENDDQLIFKKKPPAYKSNYGCPMWDFSRQIPAIMLKNDKRIIIPSTQFN